MTTLPPSERARGKRLFSVFQAFNYFSFFMFAGDLIILYILKLGGDNRLVGVVSSFKYLSFLFMFAGRALVPKMGIRRLMGTFWLSRYLMMIPALFSPLLLAAGYAREGLLLTVLALLGFQVSRGLGVVGFKPMIGAVTEEKERGDFLSKLEIISHAMAISLGLLVAFFMGKTAPLSRYVLFLSLGVVTGVASAVLVFRFPEVPYRSDRDSSNFFSGVRRALKRPGFAYFMATLFIVSFSAGLASPFAVVYAKQVYLQPDNIVIIFTVSGSLGAVFMGVITRLVIDRLGAKPIYIIFMAVFALSIIPMTLAPALGSAGILVFLVLVFFFFQMGFMGSINAAQNYFFAVVDPAEHLNLGILFNVVTGIGSAAGALSGGFILDWSMVRFVSPTGAFRFFWLFSLLLFAVAISMMLRLRRVGSYSVKDSLSILFSPRNMRAVSLLKRLDRSETSDQEVEVIKALGEAPSEVAVEELLARLKNPRYYVRSQVLVTLENLPYDSRIEEALLTEVKNHEYTTAYIAARILGKKGSARVKKALRKALSSRDYLLQANAALALGRLGDTTSVPAIERMVESSTIPLVTILCASALELLESRRSLPVLLGALKQENPPPFLRDEIILSAAAILGLGDWLYPFYTAFLESATTGIADLTDYYDSTLRKAGRKDDGGVHELLAHLTTNRAAFADAVAGLLVKAGAEDLAKAAGDSELMKFDRLAFLVAAYVVKSAVDR